MPSNTELRAMQKTTLHHLLLIKHELDKKNITATELDKYISVTIAAMEAEDVAYVQKVLERLLIS